MEYSGRTKSDDASLGNTLVIMAWCEAGRTAQPEHLQTK